MDTFCCGFLCIQLKPKPQEIGFALCAYLFHEYWIYNIFDELSYSLHHNAIKDSWFKTMGLIRIFNLKWFDYHTNFVASRHFLLLPHFLLDDGEAKRKKLFRYLDRYQRPEIVFIGTINKKDNNNYYTQYTTADREPCTEQPRTDHWIKCKTVNANKQIKLCIALQVKAFSLKLMIRQVIRWMLQEMRNIVQHFDF